MKVKKQKSQRDAGFNGGIQAGSTAFDVDSRKLDEQVKGTKESIGSKFPGLTVERKLTNEMKIKYFKSDCLGFEPDGGLYFKGGELRLVIEAKKQNALGNAQERWWDNATTARHINPNVKYVTFCTGAGAASGGPLDRLSKKAHVVCGENFVFHLKPAGFLQSEVDAFVRDAITSIS